MEVNKFTESPSGSIAERLATPGCCKSDRVGDELVPSLLHWTSKLIPGKRVNSFTLNRNTWKEVIALCLSTDWGVKSYTHYELGGINWQHSFIPRMRNISIFTIKTVLWYREISSTKIWGIFWISISEFAHFFIWILCSGICTVWISIWKCACRTLSSWDLFALTTTFIILICLIVWRIPHH